MKQNRQIVMFVKGKLPVIALFILILFYSSYLFFACGEKKAVGNGIFHMNGKQYIGAETCSGCHSKIHQTFLSTPHYNTSSAADSSTIKGRFHEPFNEYIYNQRETLRMLETDSGFYQAGYIDNELNGQQRFDITIGSGTKGQTFLHWVGNRLVQLPASYDVLDSVWTSSPGYPPHRFLINRPISGSCLNCHSTYFEMEVKMNRTAEFDKGKILYGIQCERCHGPAAEHVAFQTKNPGAPAKYILTTRNMTRQRKVDMCAQCHSAKRKTLAPAFSFLPGDSLMDNYMGFANAGMSREVHGNQYDLLATSKCYINSPSLACTTCHDPHKKERSQLAMFSTKCISCHQDGKEKICPKTKSLWPMIQSNCIDCHMPLDTSEKITFRASNEKKMLSEIARSHYISIYREKAKEIERMLLSISNQGVPGNKSLPR